VPEQQDILASKRILLGVTGSIAAYKAVELLRALTSRRAEVRVALTKNAERFVPRLTFETLSGSPALCDDSEFDAHHHSGIGHIGITDALDAVLIAPATANCIGKIAAGIADDSLTSAVMAASCPLVIAPAMNDRMYSNPVLQRNIATLKTLGVRFIEPGTGSLACGTSGRGRLASLENIISGLESLFVPRVLAGKTVLVTAGPTRETIDAVRFISNPSTGKMGYALAAAARDAGADVVLISGPSHLTPPAGVRTVAITSAREMHATVMQESASANIVLMSAAVSDFAPATAVAHKVKKNEASLDLRLERTPDILAELGRDKRGKFLLGFAAETDAVEQHAIQKLAEKNLDLIVVNDVSQSGAGFGTETNSVVILGKNGYRQELSLAPKTEIARAIVAAVASAIARAD
jgi:phosphopantothenoylcysteine decarboxylase/phosphopantothenate--cysteine ligase